MKKVNLIAMFIAFIFIAIIGLVPVNAQSSVEFGSIAVTPGNAATIDSANMLSEEVASLQAQVDEKTGHISNQSDRIQYYGLLRDLANAKAAYHAQLALVDPDLGYLNKQSAWRLRQEANTLQNRIYTMATNSPPTVQHTGKTTIGQ